MKSSCWLGTMIAAVVAAQPVHAQNYSVDWSTIDGGSGTSTGGVYSVSGTIGQYSITGGFWALPSAVQVVGAPLLRIELTVTNTAIVSWPFPSTGFVLQQNTNLNTTNWITPSETVTYNGTNRFISVSPAPGNRFYRLFKP